VTTAPPGAKEGEVDKRDATFLLWGFALGVNAAAWIRFAVYALARRARKVRP
jgi:hypothetical protein